MAEHLARAREERLGVLRLAQGAGSDRAHASRRLFAQALAETLQTGERSLTDLFLEPFGLVEALGERNAFAQAIEHHQLPVDVLRDDHVEAVRSQIDGRDCLALRRSCAQLRRHARLVLLIRSRRSKPAARLQVS